MVKTTEKPAKIPKGYFGWTLIDGHQGHVALKDVLHNLSVRENGDSKDTGHIVGVMSTLVACGMTFDDAAQLVWQHLPDDTSPDRVPESWHDKFSDKFNPKGLVKINADQGLYVLKVGDGYTCLGFDFAYDRAMSVAQWIKAESAHSTVREPDPALKGTVAGYKQYRRIMDAGFEFNRTTGKQCNASLTEQLIGKENCRVEVTDQDGQTRRFWVGKSTGWMPCHLEIARTNSSGGPAVYGAPFKSVTIIKRRR